MIIRNAVERDIYELVQMGRDFFKLTMYADKTKYDEQSIEKFIRYLMADGIMVVAVDGPIKGFIGIAITSICWNDQESIANELFWWGSQRAMVEVFTEAERQLTEKEVMYLCMSSLTNMRPEVTDKFYTKRGFENMGNFYIKELSCHLSS